MLLSRNEMDFDFHGATFDLGRVADRRLLGWVFNQFLYGEVTGIQCGHWLYRAPHLNAAQFLARQATEELSHVRKILRILSLLGESPAPAHWAIRFLATGMMGGSWGEHVTLEMALGEGLVLSVFYGMARTIDDPAIRRILESAIAEEEGHVEFGERETIAWLRAHPGDRRFLLAQAKLQAWVLTWLRRFVLAQVKASFGEAGHPVLSRFDGFYDQAIENFETRIARLGLGKAHGASLLLTLAFGIPYRRLRAIFARAPRLTSTYLSDPQLLEERERARSPGALISS